jgi:hypothetical protein
VTNLHMFTVEIDHEWTTLWVSLDHHDSGGIQVQMSSPWGAFAHFWDRPGECSLEWLLDRDHEQKFIGSARRNGVCESKVVVSVGRAMRAWPALVEQMRAAVAKEVWGTK